MSEKRVETPPQKRVGLKERKIRTKPIWVPFETVVCTDPNPRIRSRRFMGEVKGLIVDKGLVKPKLIDTENQEVKLRWQDCRKGLEYDCFCVIWTDEEGRERFGWISRAEDGTFLGPGGKKLKVKERPKRKRRTPKEQYPLPWKEKEVFKS